MPSSNFSSLRSSRKSLLGKLAEEARKEGQKFEADARFWKLTVDAKTKIGSARLRFLAAPKNEELPWVRVFSHAFQSPAGGWFIENCPTTLGQRPCPVCQDNSRLWNAGDEDSKNIARKRKRKLQFISNILVIDDPAKPENNGKVFLFKYGAKIHDKLKEAIEPEFPDVQPMNPFDMWEGADFKLRSRDYQGFQNYDKSEFADPSELFEGDDEKKEEIWNAQHSLVAFTDEKEFKDFATLEARYKQVMSGNKETAEDAIRNEKRDDDDALTETAKEVAAKSEKPERKKAAPARRPVAKPTPEPETESSDVDTDDIKKFFGELDEED